MATLQSPGKVARLEQSRGARDRVFAAALEYVAATRTLVRGANGAFSPSAQRRAAAWLELSAAVDVVLAGRAARRRR